MARKLNLKLDDDDDDDDDKRKNGEGKRRRFGEKGDGKPKKKNHRELPPVCKYCKNCHRGRCWDLDNLKSPHYGADKKGGKNWEGTGVSKKKYEHIHKMFVKKRHKRKRYDTNSDSSSDSDSDSSYNDRSKRSRTSRKGWRRGLSCNETLCMTVELGQPEAADDSNISLEASPKEILRARKRAKKNLKRK